MTAVLSSGLLPYFELVAVLNVAAFALMFFSMVEPDETDRAWQFHAHLVTTGIEEASLKKALNPRKPGRPLFPRSPAIYRPVVILPLAMAAQGRLFQQTREVVDPEWELYQQRYD